MHIINKCNHKSTVKLYYIKTHSLQPFVARVFYTVKLQKQQIVVMNDF